ncbi:hypothetical protein EAI_00586 [Harpegnathos saltator]|uniref:Uncharacterized protein n=1 Tax=Harpegnathos saltator TaxID=610380 RepID=E2C2F3_HARSA|nr:hypothetical protein EAI_00586 [Harpegnathos saltator]
MVARGDNATINPPYYFRHSSRKSAKSQIPEDIPEKNEENMIRATHVTLYPKAHEKIKIVFKEVNNTCLATADSVSNKWFLIFDYGVNYCNLRNLVVGTGLDRYGKFLELTSNAVCTQFNMAVCG